MTKEAVVELMESSQNESEWNSNCDFIKRNFHGYPRYWFEVIILSGLADRVAQKWGGDTNFHIMTIDKDGN